LKRVLLLLVFGIGLSFAACEVPEDYGVRYQEPVVNLKFNNADSTKKINALVTSMKADIAHLDTIPTDSAATALKTLEKELKALEYAQTTLKSGRYKIDTLWDVQSGNYITFEDSATVFELPLSMYQDSTIFLIRIGALKDTLQVNYDLRTFESDSVLAPQAYDLYIVEKPLEFFKSAKLNNCTDEICISDELIITLTY
jgi:hypothetical protein